MSSLIDGINHLKSIKAGIVSSLIAHGATGAKSGMKLAATPAAIESLVSEGGDAFEVWGDNYVYGYTGDENNYTLKTPIGVTLVSGYGVKGVNNAVLTTIYNNFYVGNKDDGEGDYLSSLYRRGSTDTGYRLWIQHSKETYYAYWWD